MGASGDTPHFLKMGTHLFRIVVSHSAMDEVRPHFLEMGSVPC